MTKRNHLFDGLLDGKDLQSQFAIIPPPEADVKTRYYRYSDVHSVSARFAHLLVKRGLKPGDRVAVQVEKSIEAIMLYLATVRAGGVFLPLNTAYTKNEVAYFLEDAKPTIFVCMPQRAADYADMAGSVGAHLETLGVWSGKNQNAGTMTDNPETYSEEFDNVERGPDDLAAILYTSGTTGRSKGAMLTHDNLLSNSVALVDLWQFSKTDVLLHVLPIFHTHGLFVATNVSLLGGGSVLFLPGFKADEVIEHLPNATALMGVPTVYTRLLDEDRFTADLVSHMRLFVSGSAPLLAETHVAFEARTGHKVLERYGMTETNMITSNPFDGERRAGTVGFPLPGVSCRICEPESGTEVPKGEVGVIEVKGPNVFKGYWNMPEKTAEEFRADGYFITGDLAQIDDDGYIQIVGRAKDLIISGGYNIYPKEVELMIDDLDHVLESAVVGIPHADFGEAVVAVVVPSSDAFNIEEAMATIKPQIARFKQPKLIHVIDELPRNTMGKVQKNVLRDMLKDSFSA